MTSDAYRQGQDAARKDIPAEANPFPKDSADHAQWQAGHESVATAREAGESEGS